MEETGEVGGGMRLACRSTAISVLILAIVVGPGLVYPAEKLLKNVELLTNYVSSRRKRSKTGEGEPASRGQGYMT